MAEIVVTCTCGSVPDFAKRWLKNTPHPDTQVLTTPKLKNFLPSLPPQAPLRTRLEAVLKKRGRFAFYFSYNEHSYQILEEVDILHGHTTKTRSSRM